MEEEESLMIWTGSSIGPINGGPNWVLKHTHTIRIIFIGFVIIVIVFLMDSLHEILNQFKEQQEKCQEALSSIAAKAKASTTTPSPVGSQIKRVVDLLLQTRQALTEDELIDACKIERSTIQTLKQNPRLNFDGRFFSYKAKHEVEDEHELLNLILRNPEGLLVADLKDAYPTVMEDVEAMKKSNKIWVMTNLKKQEIAYPNDPRMQSIKVDDDLKQMFRDIELPLDMLEIEKDLRSRNQKPATDTAKRRAMAQAHPLVSAANRSKKKKGEITNRTKLTNAHLPELFFKN